ncbi:MAG: hypothetical protein AMXMBFR64_08130 [Myxococcales bacterium]
MAHKGADVPTRRLGAGRKLFVAALLLVGAGTAAVLAERGWDYYGMNAWERAERPDLATLGSSGAAGLAYGIAGTALILVNLTYLLRRHVPFMRQAGSLRTWMELHVLTGLLGPLLVLFHSAFELRTELATGALSALGVLVVTGIVGRYIYAQVPRTVSGAEAGPQALSVRADQAEAALARALGPGSPHLDAIRALAGRENPVPRSRLLCLLMLPVISARTLGVRLAIRSLGRRIARDCESGVDTGAVLADLEDVVLIRQRLQALETFRELMRWWRGLHRAFAILMFAAALVHIAVVTALGYGL